MAHKYDNFNAAFADLRSKYPDVKQKLEWAITNAQEAYAGASDPVDKTHFGFATYAIEQLVIAMRYLGDYIETTSDKSHLYESIYWASKSGAPAAVTWKAICEAWIKDDFAGRVPTIAVIDRMRQILWDEPFFVAWAARPEEQEL